MIWQYFARNIANSIAENPRKLSYRDTSSTVRTDTITNLAVWGTAIHAAMIFGCIILSVIFGNVGALSLIVTFFSIVDYVHSSFAALNPKITEHSGLKKKARLLAKDNSLDKDWQVRARNVYALTRKIEAKEKRYGKYDEIDQAKGELNKAIDCIVRYNMMVHTTHVEIVRNDVDAILSAYAEL